MPSSKKSRGKQRGNKDADLERMKRAVVERGHFGRPQQSIGTLLSAEKIINEVGNCDDFMTTFVTDKIMEFGGDTHVFQQELLDKGLVTTIFSLLNQCGEISFPGLLNKVNGDLRSPLMWVHFLMEACDINDDWALQIAENIGPFINCMCNDRSRLLFKSREYWHKNIMALTGLLLDLLGRDRASNILLQNKVLVESIIQWNFWATHRLDIFEEAKILLEGDLEFTVHDNDFVRSVRGLLKCVLVDDRNGFFEDRSALGVIGETPAVNREHDPTCKVSFAVGVIHLLKEERSEWYFTILNNLICRADCVDKTIIREVIDYGLNFTTSCDEAVRVLRLILGCITTGSGNKIPSDSRVAVAIKAGLIQLCLDLTTKFLQDKGAISFLECILKHCYRVSLHKKSARAIGELRAYIVEELACCNCEASGSNKDVNLVTQMIQCITDLNTILCPQCDEQIARSNIYLCNGCKRTAYCSNECQAKAWHGSWHEHMCKMGKTTLTQKSAEDLKTNMYMAQKSILLRHKDTILAQLSSLETELRDSLVLFDLRQCPPVIDVRSHNDVDFPIEDYQKIGGSRLVLGACISSELNRDTVPGDIVVFHFFHVIRGDNETSRVTDLVHCT